MADKDAFRRAIHDLRDSVPTLPAETRKVVGNSIRVAERFAGELRQEKSTLKQANELLQRDLGALKKRLDKDSANNAVLVDRLREEIGELGQLLKAASESGISMRHRGKSGLAFTVLKTKCMLCSLHFVLCTYSPEKHSSATMYCPECGQHDGAFMLWADSVNGPIYELVPGRSEYFEYPNRTLLFNPRARNPEPVGGNLTLIPTEINIPPTILNAALQELCARFRQRPNGIPPVGAIIHEDFVKDGEVLLFIFAVNTGEGRLIGGCAVPDPGKSREEQVRDLINAWPHPEKFPIETRPGG